MKSNTVRFLVLVAMALMVSFVSNAQGVKKTANYNITVKGSSNLHDWTMKASGSNIEANFNMTPGVSYLAGITSLSFNIPVAGLKSGESLMDKRAYESLNAAKYPNISFKLVSATAADPKDSKTALNVTGILTIAGNARQFTMVANSVTAADGSVTITGSKTIKMSEFGIKPPTFMLGALKVADAVTIEYATKFK